MDVKEQIAKLEEELEDLLEERKFTLGQTGVHISAKKVIALREHYDSEIAELERKIDHLKGTVVN